MVLEKHLRHALEQDQFQLVYQPQIALDSGQVVGVEALIRWRHPELGLVSPGEFVPLAEENGLIEPLGLWVLRTACLQHRVWRAGRLPGLRLAVNMSARQFQRLGLESRIREVLAETDMDARWLELELTESVLMQEGDSTASLLGHLSELGISLALDDFGTGYSSLSHLKRFPIKRIKIDRSFVCDIGTSEGDAALARAVIAMAHGLGVEVVAEGIESSGAAGRAAPLRLRRRPGLFPRPAGGPVRGAGPGPPPGLAAGPARGLGGLGLSRRAAFLEA